MQIHLVERRVEWRYRQNLLIFVRKGDLPAYPKLQQAVEQQELSQDFAIALDRKMPLGLQGAGNNALPGSRSTSISVTIGVASNGGPDRLRASLRSIAESGFADEIVVCLDRDAPEGSREAALEFTSKVHGIESQGYPESTLQQLARYCSGDFILRIDDDECLQGAWTRPDFDSLVRLNAFTHFFIPRRWLIHPGNQFIANEPWFPDLQLRLFRNDPRLIAWPRQLHEIMDVSGQGMVLADRCIDHRVLLMLSRPERHARCNRYLSMRRDHHLSFFYLYEDQDFQTLAADESGFRTAVMNSSIGHRAGALPGAVYRLGEPVDFKLGGNSTEYAVYGWHQQEPWGTWSQGEVASICLPLQEIIRGTAVLRGMVSALIVPGRPMVRAEVEYRGEVLETWSFGSAGVGERTAVIPAGILKNDLCPKFTFRIYDPASPFGLGLSADRRSLGLGFVSLRLESVA